MFFTRLAQLQRKKKAEKTTKADETQQFEAMLGDISLIARAKELTKLKN